MKARCLSSTGLIVFPLWPSPAPRLRRSGESVPDQTNRLADASAVAARRQANGGPGWTRTTDLPLIRRTL